jgi:hypothetical protein
VDRSAALEAGNQNGVPRSCVRTLNQAFLLRRLPGLLVKAKGEREERQCCEVAGEALVATLRVDPRVPYQRLRW